MVELSKPQIICHMEASTDMTLFDCRWIPCSARFVVAGTALSGCGVLRVYQVTYIPSFTHFTFSTNKLLRLLNWE